MANAYRFVKLLKNHIYPTYQLHAFMTNDKLAPQDGLRLAALTTMEWLKYRLGEAAPSEWENIPSPDAGISEKECFQLLNIVCIRSNFCECLHNGEPWMLPLSLMSGLPGYRLLGNALSADSEGRCLDTLRREIWPPV